MESFHWHVTSYLNVYLSNKNVLYWRSLHYQVFCGISIDLAIKPRNIVCSLRTEVSSCTGKGVEPVASVMYVSLNDVLNMSPNGSTKAVESLDEKNVRNQEKRNSKSDSISFCEYDSEV